jgi:endonuclease/exonuclease/phosphatase family metal-dependent hydrolase
LANRIFLNYRRADSRAEADRLYRLLCTRFGEEQVFRDMDTIRKGHDFADVIDDNLATCAAAVVLIGRAWLDVRGKDGRRRLTQQGDFVRLEIRALLRRGIPVIPVLVQGTAMPEEDALPADLRPLVRRQIALLRERHFARDATFLAKELEAALGFYHGPLPPALARSLRVLRRRIQAAAIPASVAGKTLNLAAWNIRELGKQPRRKESLHYLAEILSQFDLIGVSEAQRYDGDLRGIERLLGPFWCVLFAGGFCFLFDTRKVELAGMARQVTGLPEIGRHLSQPVALPFWRSPLVVSFRAGRTELVCVLAHVRWGPDPAGRRQELEAFAKWLAGFRERELTAAQKLVALGTFQTPSRDDESFRRLTSTGLRVPKALRAAGGSNVQRDRHWQHILAFAGDAAVFTKHGGVLDFLAGGPGPLYPGRSMQRLDVFRELSDNLPLWVQLHVG